MALPTAQELYAEVARKTQDDSYVFDDILSFFNDALNDISGQYLLPELETEEEVTTNISYSYISLPSDYQRNLFRCYSETHTRRVPVYTSLRLLLKNFSQSDLAGSVVGVTVRGSKLHYQRLPSSAETLTLYYFKKPTLLTVEGSQPDCLPEHLTKKLLVNYACKEIFSEIEDGVEGEKVNTSYYGGKYEEALKELEAFIGPEQAETKEITDELMLDSYL